ncbi:MAG: hypothetical protein WC364_12295, partial [Eubacteriales bacterium]
MGYESLEELVEQRKGYKFLSVDGVSPYKNYQYNLKCKRHLRAGNLNEDPHEDCGAGWNLATIKWIADNCLKLNGVIVECEIPKKAKIIIPINSHGKFRTDIIKFKKIHRIETLFPLLKDINDRLKNHKPINPITAETMPDTGKLKKIMDQVSAQVWDQVWDQVRDQVGAQVWAQVWDQVRDQVGDQVGDQVWDQVWDQVR